MVDSVLTCINNLQTNRSQRYRKLWRSPRHAGLLALGILGSAIAGCTSVTNTEQPLNVQLYQHWELQPGDTLGGYAVVGGLGDISIALDGKTVYAPFDGKTQWDTRKCVIFSTPDVPAYMFRLCGVNQPKVGAIARGDAIGTANILQFAALRQQTDKTWAIVEPSKTILQRTLSPS